MSRFRLLADDLTGALDRAAAFVPRFGPIPVLWHPDPALPIAALDSGARDAAPEAAHAALSPFAADLAGAELALLKLDRLLRGHPAPTIAACLRAGAFEHAVIAPALPVQGRVTRAGRQLVHGADTGIDLAAGLGALGVPVRLRRPGETAPAGVSLWDAASDAELATIAAAGRTLSGRVLWCGSAGLAGTLAGAAPPLIVPPRPVLALIGTDHPTTRRQLEACLNHSAADAAAIAAHLTGGQGVAVVPGLPDGLGRAEGAVEIAGRFAGLVRRLPRPGALFVTGGETLRALCTSLGAARLHVIGQLAPGVPVSNLVGGAWDGLPVVSKSGGFGGPALLADLLR